MITDAFCEQEPIFRIFLVGGDAYIAPWGTTPEQSGKTDTPVPSAPTKIQVSKKFPKANAFGNSHGDPPGIRTPDPLLKRQLLCQLS